MLYFIMQPVLKQSTIHHFMRKSSEQPENQVSTESSKSKELRMNARGVGNSKSESKSLVEQDVQGSGNFMEKEALSKKLNDPSEHSKLDIDSARKDGRKDVPQADQSVIRGSSIPFSRDPFSKALRKDIRLEEIPSTHKLSLEEKLDNNVNTFRRKSLNLKVRKRKQVVNTCPQNNEYTKKVCVKDSEDYLRENKPDLAIAAVTSSQISGIKNILISPEDNDIMKGYLMAVEVKSEALTLSDLEKFETWKESSAFDRCGVSKVTSGKYFSSIELPVSPTFSPRKTTFSSFSPLLLNDSCDGQSQTPNFNTSVSLFSTPSQQDSNTLKAPKSELTKVVKRALFPHNVAKTESYLKVSGHHVSDFSEFSDISLSEFLNTSTETSAETSAETYTIDRYLVLEVTSQTSIDNGR